MTKRKKGNGQGKFPVKRGRDTQVIINPFMSKVTAATKKSEVESNEIDFSSIKVISKIKVDCDKNGKILIESMKFDHVGPEIAGIIDADKQIYADEIIVYPKQFYKDVKLSILEVGDGTVNENNTKKIACAVTAKNALLHLSDENKCPCTLREGLEFIKLNPWWSARRHCVAMLGTIVKVQGRLFVPFLFTWLIQPDTKKGIYLLPYEGKFSANTIFLATDCDPNTDINESY